MFPGLIIEVSLLLRISRSGGQCVIVGQVVIMFSFIHGDVSGKQVVM